MNILLTNLSLNAIESDIQRLFMPFGEINSITILRDKWNNRPKGLALVDMPISSEAENAIERLHKTEFAGKVISVSSTSYEEGFR